MNSRIFWPTCLMGVAALVLFLCGFFKGERQHIEGLRLASKMVVEIFPMLIFAFFVAGMVQVLLPRNMLSQWIGEESGLRGLLIGTVAGAFCPGGPYTSLPLAASFLRSGASIGTLVAFLTSWSLWAVARLPMEVGILGWRFTIIRFISTFFFPPIAGFIAYFISSRFS